jgi:hypothetical protein
VRLQQPVLDALLHAQLAALLVLQYPQREGEGAGLLRDLGKHGARRLHLEGILCVGRLAVDRRRQVVRLPGLCDRVA